MIRFCIIVFSDPGMLPIFANWHIFFEGKIKSI